MTTRTAVSTAPGLTSLSEPTADMGPLLRRYWGFDTLRPLQREAIRAGLAHRDSLVVMPTGGGKSLCYQVPPLLAQRLDVVVSPLISLMKDQVDSLREAGYPAAALHSNMAPVQRAMVLDGVAAGHFRLLFVSPERLVMPGFLSLLQGAGVQAFAVDEAHCISHWGHDFRPEYRQLATLKDRFPGASLHAFTATATPRVRTDIAEQLHLDQPEVLIGCFDRPNLTYRILPRIDLRRQVLEAVQRHHQESVICYCITRSETERLADFLRTKGIRAAAYHAGMEPEQRGSTQEAFAEEALDVVVATVAFGMGIDRSNVRCVIHAGMPKSIEHYQQETGRAGRDGLEAECVLLYSAADVIRWKQIVERRDPGMGDPQSSSQEAGARLELLRHMQGLCSTLQCRHRALSHYFGQSYPADSCGACDVCLEEVEAMAESTTIAQKILSCVARLDQRYGVGYLVQILRGSAGAQIRDQAHDQLSTYGILRELSDKVVTNLVYQLVDQGLLERTLDDRPVLRLTQEAVTVLRGDQQVRLLQPKSAPAKQTKAASEGWEGVDRELFEHLRQLRARLAHERSVPAYVVFGDKTLREMARIKPANSSELLGVHGVGDKKLADFGDTFVQAICDYCAEQEASSA